MKTATTHPVKDKPIARLGELLTILEHLDLPHAQHYVFRYILEWHAGGRSCCARVSTIAKAIRRSEPTVERAIRALKAEKLIIVQARNHTKGGPYTNLSVINEASPRWQAAIEMMAGSHHSDGSLNSSSDSPPDAGDQKKIEISASPTVVAFASLPDQDQTGIQVASLPAEEQSPPVPLAPPSSPATYKMASGFQVPCVFNGKSLTLMWHMAARYHLPNVNHFSGLDEPGKHTNFNVLRSLSKQMSPVGLAKLIDQELSLMSQYTLANKKGCRISSLRTG